MMRLGVLLGLCAALAHAYWGEPKKLGRQINHIDSTWEALFAHISPTGRQLYFTAAHWTWEEDIYVARWNPAIADWDSVTRLPLGNVNTKERDFSPSVTADERRLYFTTYDRPGGRGSYDIWYSDWDSVQGTWGPAQNCGPNVNSRGMEFTSYVMPDGKRLYFSSMRAGTGWLRVMYSDLENGVFGPAHDCWQGSYLPVGDLTSPWVSADERTMYMDRPVSGDDRDVLCCPP